MHPSNDPEINLQRRLIAQGREQLPELGLFGTLWTYVWAAAGVLIAASIIFAILGSVLETLQNLWAAQSNALRVLGGTAAVIAIAGPLYFLRRTKLAVYGLLELAFGLASTAHASKTLPGKDRTDISIIMVGCVYLIVRGLDNYFRGRNEHRKPTVPLHRTN
jgi:hypothetical protein